MPETKPSASTSGGVVLKLQWAQIGGLVVGLGGGGVAVTTANAQLEQAQEALGAVSAQLERLEQRMEAEDVARVQRLADQAVGQAEAKAERAVLEGRLATLEACHRAPRQCPLR